MTQVQSHKSSHNDHQNCENCVRQKKQNQTWIKIYQRLQEVEKNTHRLSNAVQEHKLSNQTNRSFYKSFEQKIISLPKVKKAVNSNSIQNAGFEVAIGLLQKQSRSKLIEQNGRLKKILNQMRKQRWEEETSQNTSHNNSQYFTERTIPKNLQQTSLSMSLVSTHFRENDQLPLRLEKRHSQETKENSSTKSSSFNITPKNTFDLSRYNDLNLWLYQSDKHSKMEEDLFAPRSGVKHSLAGKRNSQILPAINPKK